MLTTHQKLVRLIRAHLGEDDAALLAEPVLDDEGGVVGWRDPSGGALSGPTPALQNAARQAIARIEGLAEQLEAQGDMGALAGLSLRLAVTRPEGADTVVSDSRGRPVLIHWGMAAPGQSVPGRVVPPATASDTALTDGAQALAAAEQAEDAQMRRRQSSRRRAVAWVVPAALAGVAVWLGLQAAEPLPVETVVLTPPAPDAPDPRLGLAERLAAITKGETEATAALPRFAAVCKAPPPPPEPVVVAPPTPTVDPELAGQCKGGASQEPGEVLMIVDASGSMRNAMGTPPEMTRKIHRLWKSGQQRAFELLSQRADNLPGPSRMDIAHRLVREVVGQTPKDVNIGLVSFHHCGVLRRTRPVPHGRRAELLRTIGRVRPSQGTPLAEAILAAGAMIKGGKTKDDPVNLVVISDGLDSCGGNPCWAAASLKKQRPGVSISVVDLSGFDALSCVARETGGIYRSRGAKVDVDEMVRMTRTAALRHACLPATE